MADWKFTYQKMLGYLKGDFSSKQRYELERNTMQDAFEDEAFDGLTELDGEIFEKDIFFLKERLEKQTKKNSKFYFSQPLRIAASLLIVFGLGVLLYQFTRPNEPNYEFVVSPEFKKDSNSEIVDSEIIEEEAPEVVYQEVEEKGLPNFSVRGESVKREIDIVKTPVNKKPNIDSNIDNNGEVPREAKAKIAFEETEVQDEIEEIILSKKSEVSNVSKPQTEILDKEIQNNSNLWKGMVTDEDGNPLPGVNITIVGTNQGVVTDFEGNYEIEASKDVKLEATYLGFDSVAFDYENSPKVILTEDLASLEEIVVVGYGTTKQKTATKLTNIELAVVENRKTNSANKVLRKRSAGVKVLSSQKAEEAEDSTSKFNNIYGIALPPQGSKTLFKNWVLTQLDPSKFDAGVTYKIKTQFTVNEIGEIIDYKAVSNVKSAIKKQLKKTILNSENWKPATNNTIPVTEKIELEFRILAE